MVIFHSFLYVHQRVFSFSIICPMKMTILGCISWYMTHFPTHAIWHFVPTCLVVLKHHGTSTIDSWFSQLYLHLWGDFRIIIRLPCLMIPEEINRRWTIDEPSQLQEYVDSHCQLMPGFTSLKVDYGCDNCIAEFPSLGSGPNQHGPTMKSHGRQMVPGKKAKKKIQNLRQKKNPKTVLHPNPMGKPMGKHPATNI